MDFYKYKFHQHESQCFFINCNFLFHVCIYMLMWTLSSSLDFFSVARATPKLATKSTAAPFSPLSQLNPYVQRSRKNSYVCRNFEQNMFVTMITYNVWIFLHFRFYSFLIFLTTAKWFNLRYNVSRLSLRAVRININLIPRLDSEERFCAIFVTAIKSSVRLSRI